MALRIEVLSEAKLPKTFEPQVQLMLSSVPREHLRGLDRIRVVDSISDPRLKNVPQASELPGLYHPKQGGSNAWFEIAIEVLLPRNKPWHKRIMPRMAFKGNLAAILFSLVGQHYHLTLKHSVKRGQIEPAVRAYTEKQLRQWQEQQKNWRTKLFKPLQPTFERWAKSLQKRAAAEKKKSG